eukprot:4617372-Amphidinium_carterae.1
MPRRRHRFVECFETCVFQTKAARLCTFATFGQVVVMIADLILQELHVSVRTCSFWQNLTGAAEVVASVASCHSEPNPQEKQHKIHRAS